MPRSIFQMTLAGLLILAMSASPVAANDKAELSALLDHFLAGASVSNVEIHDAFWADELVYTSSSGQRTTKADILASMAAAPETPSDTPPAIVYSAEKVDIRTYDNMAIVAFELVGTPTNGESQIQRYLNTGTFIKRDDRWQAIAWQATIKAAQ
ncbi:MAG: nuclear transport factor 2 family protein [Woeseiaceae bacterium]